MELTRHIGFNDPALVLQHALKNLNPGGWIEYQDVTLDVWSPDGSHKGLSSPHSIRTDIGNGMSNPLRFFEGVRLFADERWNASQGS